MEQKTLGFFGIFSLFVKDSQLPIVRSALPVIPRELTPIPHGSTKTVFRFPSLVLEQGRHSR